MRVLIVDDEPLARKRIRRFLRDHDCEIAGECVNGIQAVAAIEKQKPDVIFLDIQMPGMDGFEVIAAVGVERMPVIVFVTAYDEYALRAFEVHALDYLLKPISRSRFQAVVERLQTNLHQRKDTTRELLALLDEHRGRTAGIERLLIKSQGRTIFLNTQEIDSIQAEGNYSRIRVGATTHLLRETLGNLAEKLNHRQFLRIHRSIIVNVDRIRELRPWFRGDYVVLLKDGTELTLSRTYREKVRKALKQDF